MSHYVKCGITLKCGLSEMQELLIKLNSNWKDKIRTSAAGDLVGTAYNGSKVPGCHLIVDGISYGKEMSIITMSKAEDGSWNINVETGGSTGVRSEEDANGLTNRIMEKFVENSKEKLVNAAQRAGLRTESVTKSAGITKLVFKGPKTNLFNSTSGTALRI